MITPSDFAEVTWLTCKSLIANKFANEMVSLRSTIQEQKVELDALKSSTIKAEKENSALETELSNARKKIDEKEEEIVELYLLQDNLEQYTRKQSL